MKQAWIGLSAPEDADASTHAQNFVWISGEKPTFVNWSPKQPSNYRGKEDCTIFNTEAKAPRGQYWRAIKKWNDGKCSEKYNAICQYKKYWMPRALCEKK